MDQNYFLALQEVFKASISKLKEKISWIFKIIWFITFDNQTIHMGNESFCANIYLQRFMFILLSSHLETKERDSKIKPVS